MACEAGEEERVQALAAELDSMIRVLKRRLGEIGDRRLAVMAGITILEKLKRAEEDNAELRHRIARLERAREEAALAADDEDEPLIARLDAATAAVERLTHTLNDEIHALAEEESGGATFGRAAPSAASDPAHDGGDGDEEAGGAADPAVPHRRG